MLVATQYSPYIADIMSSCQIYRQEIQQTETTQSNVIHVKYNNISYDMDRFRLESYKNDCDHICKLQESVHQIHPQCPALCPVLRVIKQSLKLTV